DRPGRRGRAPRRRGAPPHQDRVPPARRAGAEPGPRALARGAARARVGLRLLRRRSPRRCPRSPAAHQGRARSGEPASRRHRPRSGLQAPVVKPRPVRTSRLRPWQRLGLRAQITITFTLGGLLLAGVLGGATLYLTRQNLLDQRQTNAIRAFGSNAADLDSRLSPNISD